MCSSYFDCSKVASIDGPRPLWQPAISLLYSVLYCLYFVLAINSVCVISVYEDVGIEAHMCLRPSVTLT